jgi:hypothetical protein
MTPKKKAKELVFKFIQYTPVEYEYEYAIQCALIAVDEILKAVTTIADKKYDYFVEVKQELNNLKNENKSFLVEV